MLDRLDKMDVGDSDVIRWGCPVPAFGNVSTAKVATLGLNPSNREFVDQAGDELCGRDRRFHTLGSLGLTSWSEADASHLELILESCRSYFNGNPFDRWFRKLDGIVRAASASFYDPPFGACHLDLVPYATSCKWSGLSKKGRSELLAFGADTLGLLLRDSDVQVLILNGQSVVRHFEDVTGVKLEKRAMPAWRLPRATTKDVTGYAYVGVVDSIHGIDLCHDIVVLGYNHNLQSSYGITNSLIESIRTWITSQTEGVLI